VNSAQISSEYILREKGTRYESQNIEKSSDLKSVIFHVAAFVFWHHKDPLQFYNDENDFLNVKIFKSRKPRKRKYESKEEHHQRIIEREAFLPHDVKIESKSNSMTQIYYVQRLLSVYLQSYNEA
jgi:hypothetical protein